jgi:glycosyltransferase involved in cell wall biosynthesis
MRVIYLSYDGLLEPLGQSQVVSYLRGLARRHRLTVLSFEKPADLRAGWRPMAEALRAQGIAWRWLRYHKRPTVPATAWDIARGVAAGVLAAEGGIDLLHARGYVASMIALALKRLTAAGFLFDMRGFWADEKADAGQWRRDSMVYRAAKRWERRFFAEADGLVSLTHAGVAAWPRLGLRVPPERPVAVIPTCVDLDRFHAGPGDAGRRTALGLDGALVLGYVGTMDTWYLREPMLRFAARLLARVPQARFLVVTRDAHAPLREALAGLGAPMHRVVFTRATFEEMPGYLRLMDLGAFFIRPCLSKLASAATRLAEFLATGVPVAINDGIGDSGPLVRDHGVGVVLDRLEPDAFDAAIDRLLALRRDPATADRCRALAERVFSLEHGVAAYDRLYHAIADARSAVVAPSPLPLRPTSATAACTRAEDPERLASAAP